MTNGRAIRRKVDKDLAQKADQVFETSVQSAAPGRTFAQDFGARKMEQDIRVLDMPKRSLTSAWESCVQKRWLNRDKNLIGIAAVKE